MHTILQRMLREKLIAVVRLRNHDEALEAVTAMAAGGITIVEITLTTPGAFGIIRELSSRNDLLVGAGTVLSREDASMAFDAGARFYASPVFDPELIAMAHEAGNVAMPGAYTPTEIVQAARAGADLVKIFPMPADPVHYLKALRGPLPDLPMAPSGGISSSNAGDLLRAGASALNVGSWLTHHPDGELAQGGEIRRRARELVAAVAQASRR